VVLSDAELVRAAQRGDATSLGILLERHRTPLYGLALQILGRGPARPREPAAPPGSRTQKFSP